VADLGGTLLAYLAWKKQIENQQLSDQDGFTPVQRFFIGMAQWACEIQRPENLRVSAITNPHSPGLCAHQWRGRQLAAVRAGLLV
jgi:endothelin-converting enzyme/putative endopeptidase